jgi:hypothetical protein
MSPVNTNSDISNIRDRLTRLINEKSRLEGEIEHRKKNQQDVADLTILLDAVLPDLDRAFSTLQLLVGKRENW